MSKHLIQAVQRKSLSDIEKLISAGADINYKDKDKLGFGWSVLHHGIFQAGFFPEEGGNIVKFLLKNGADIDAIDRDGNTPVLSAVKFFALEILDILVQKGANIHVLNKKKQSAFDIILGSYYDDQYLDEKHLEDIKNKKEKEAVLKGEGEALRRMFSRIDAIVKNGYDLNAGKYPAAYSTLLEIAVNQLTPKALTYLFDKGANLNEYIKRNDGDGFSSLLGEAIYQKLPLEVLVKMINKIGVNYVFKKDDDCTPLIYAVMYDNLKLVQKLIDLGANKNVQNGSPLRTACAEGYVDIVKCLVENGARIDVSGSDGSTPLSLAKEGEFEKIVSYLKSKK